MSLSPNAKKVLGDFVLDELEETINEAKRKIANLRIKGLHHKAEQKEKALRFYWEFWSELKDKITDLEHNSNFKADEDGTVYFR